MLSTNTGGRIRQVVSRTFLLFTRGCSTDLRPFDTILSKVHVHVGLIVQEKNCEYKSRPGFSVAFYGVYSTGHLTLETEVLALRRV